MKLVLNDKLLNYCCQYGIREHPTLQWLRAESAKITTRNLLISPEQGALLALLAQISQAKTCLELGVFTGYSTLWLALAIPEHGTITAIDNLAQPLAPIAWLRAGVQHKIHYKIAAALDVLAVLPSISYDLIFIDANKSQYMQYYEYAVNLSHTGSLIILDNTLHQDIATNSTKKPCIALHRLNLTIQQDSRVEMCMLAIGGGMTIARKL